MKPTKSKRGLVKKSVSFPTVLFLQGEQRAKVQGRNFSNYLQQLVRADMAEDQKPELAEAATK